MMQKIMFWGTGDAHGVPRMLCSCGVCQGRSPDNKRKRCTVALHAGGQTALIDVSPDFRSQVLSHHNGENVPSPVFITHAHHDHISGFGDYSDLCFRMGANSEVVSPADVIDDVLRRYPYLVNRRGIVFEQADSWHFGPWNVSFHRVNHGHNGYSYGLRFQGRKSAWGYISDGFAMSEMEWMPFRDVQLLILGTSFWNEQSHDRAHRSVYDVQEAIALKQEMRIPRMILTHLSHDVDIPNHEPLLPEGMLFARDGMEVDLSELAN